MPGKGVCGRWCDSWFCVWDAVNSETIRFSGFSDLLLSKTGEPMGRRRLLRLAAAQNPAARGTNPVAGPVSKKRPLPVESL
jgi:hypothetical protein